MPENQSAVQIAAKHSIFPQMAPQCHPTRLLLLLLLLLLYMS